MERLQNLIGTIRSRRLLFDLGQVGAATTVANVLLYLFQLVVGRSLGPEDYSLFSALFGIVYLGSNLANSVQVSVAKLVSSALARSDSTQAGTIVTSILMQVIVIGAFLFGAFALAASSIASYLHSDSVLPVLITGLVIILFLWVPVTMGALQGAERFRAYAGVLLTFASTRLLFAIAALATNLGTLGVLVGAGIASLVTAITGLALVKPPITLRKITYPDRESFLKVLPAAVIGTIAIGLPGSADLFLVRHFFSAEQAGLYAGASILGKVVLILPMAVSTVLLPRFTHDRTLENTSLRLLYRGVLLTAVISGATCVGFVLLPRLALSILLGPEYASADSLVPLYAITMFLFSLSVVFLHYNFAAGQTTYFYFILLPHLALQIILVYAFHQTLSQVLMILLATHVSLLICSYLFTWILGSHQTSQEARL